MPLTHKELRECMRVLGYQFDGGGSCFGVANMGKQALLTGEMEVFNKRLIRIKEVLLPLIRQQHQLLYKSRLSGMKETDVVPINEKQLVSYKDWSDVYAFFDGVNAYQSPRIYANLFETGRQLTQDSRPISPVITPIVLEDQGIVTLPSFSGAYDALSLKTYFLCLDEAFSNLPYSVSLDISLADHQISCLYDSKAKKWTLLDVDFLEYADKSFSADEIAKLIIKEYGPHLIFSDTPSVIAKDQDHLTAVFTALDQNPQWIDIHKPTAARTLMRNKDGSSWVYLAAMSGDIRGLKALIENRAELDLPDLTGLTPICVAVQEGHLQAVKTLRDGGATVDYLMADGSTPLFIAAKNENLTIVNELIGSGAMVERVRKDGVTPLFVAAYYGNSAVINTLILHGANFDKVLANGATPFAVAVENGHIAVAKMLLDKGANIEQAMTVNVLGLLSFAKKNKRENQLLELFSNKNIQDTVSGFTSLHNAVFLGHKDMVRMLLENGAQLKLTDKGISVFDLAFAMNRIDIIEQMVPYLTAPEQTEMRQKVIEHTVKEQGALQLKMLKSLYDEIIKPDHKNIGRQAESYEILFSPDGQKASLDVTLGCMLFERRMLLMYGEDAEAKKIEQVISGFMKNSRDVGFPEAVELERLITVYEEQNQASAGLSCN